MDGCYFQPVVEGRNMSETTRSKHNLTLEDSIPQASLESILCTEELHRRWRSPDYEKENRGLVALVSALADSPRTILQTLAETILDITQCDSAGVSLLTRDGKTPDVSGKRFYWPAIVGRWSPHVGGGTPRNFGPCGLRSIRKPKWALTSKNDSLQESLRHVACLFIRVLFCWTSLV
jgi:hypothetical protein